MLLSPQSLLSVHDSVAQKNYDPELPPLPDNICDEEEDSVKIVRLVKKEEPLVTILLFSISPTILIGEWWKTLQHSLFAWLVSNY